jgi:RNA polymerase sigma-70 factor (ECF subfamily)
MDAPLAGGNTSDRAVVVRCIRSINRTNEGTAAVTRVVHDGVEATWRQLATDVRAFILRRVASPEDADDIMQVVFLRMIERIDSVRDTERLTGWLFVITRNAITDYYRAAPRRRELPVDVIPDHTVAQDGEDESEQELARCLLPMVDRLPAEQAEAIRMVDLAGMSQAAAAASVHVSHSGMKSRVQRGRARLRELLVACCHVELDVRGRAQGCGSRPAGRECG